MEMSIDDKLRDDRRIERCMDRSGIPKLFKDKTFDDYRADGARQKEIFGYISAYVDKIGTSTGLIFIGKPGTGKNHLATSLIKAAIVAGINKCQIITASKIIRTIKESWGRKDLNESEILDKFINLDLLIIDEIGMQFGSDTEKLYLSEIINDRYEKIKTTILIGNVTMEQLEKQVGERIIDRFREGGKVLVFDWESHRGK